MSLPPQPTKLQRNWLRTAGVLLLVGGILNAGLVVSLARLLGGYAEYGRAEQGRYFLAPNTRPRLPVTQVSKATYIYSHVHGWTFDLSFYLSALGVFGIILSRRVKRLRIRFGLRTFCMVPVAFALGWWWTTWPDRTANQFLSLISDGDFEHANILLRAPAVWRSRPDGEKFFDDGHCPSSECEVWWRVDFWKQNFQPPLLQFHPRTATDWIVGRRRLVVNNALWPLFVKGK